MMLVEQTTVPVAVLPVAEFKDHLRLGTGFADESLQDGLLETCLRAAMAAIEARTGKIVLERSFSWTLTRWRELGQQALPVAPITQITGLRMTDRHGATTTVAAELYRLERDAQRPKIVAETAQLPLIPTGGSVEIDFDAGFGASWAEIPSDLRQAMFLLGARFYEHRGGGMSDGLAIPPAASVLIDRYRTVRLYGEGGL